MSFINKKHQDYKRAIWHFLGIGCASLLFWFCNDLFLGILVGFGLLFLFVDWRRSVKDLWAISLIKFFTGKFFFNMLRDSEKNQISSGAKFVFVGLVVVVLKILFDLPRELATCSGLMLAVGDPIARIVGKEWKHNGFNGLVGLRWRRMCLYGKKTFAGSASFFIFSVLVVYLFSSIANVEMSWLVLIAGVVTATLVELFTTDWDNFWVPFSALMTMWLIKVLV